MFFPYQLENLETHLILRALKLKQLYQPNLLDANSLLALITKYSNFKKTYSDKTVCVATQRRHSVKRLTQTSRFFTKKSVELGVFPGVTRTSW